MLKSNKQLIFKTNCLKFENKGLIEALKAKKKKKNRGKRLNLLSEKDDGPQLFSFLRVQATYNFIYDKKVEKSNKKKMQRRKKKSNKRRKYRGK